mmetsp:Transcript_17241/g.38148  ORF Transcript_17241/g.38148 Transcript_17241/m.38148 type:complete len:216 (-) Transcript_17241:904-1551(-)
MFRHDQRKIVSILQEPTSQRIELRDSAGLGLEPHYICHLQNGCKALPQKLLLTVGKIRSAAFTCPAWQLVRVCGGKQWGAKLVVTPVLSLSKDAMIQRKSSENSHISSLLWRGSSPKKSLKQNRSIAAAQPNDLLICQVRQWAPNLSCPLLAHVQQMDMLGGLADKSVHLAKPSGRPSVEGYVLVSQPCTKQASEPGPYLGQNPLGLGGLELLLR